jgi:hypothetical protein
VFPYLSLVLKEELLYVGVSEVEIWLVDSNNVGADGFHFAEKVEDVKAVGSTAKPIDILKINLDDVGCLLMVVKVRSPWLVRFEVSGSDGSRLSGSVKGLGGGRECGG